MKQQIKQPKEKQMEQPKGINNLPISLPKEDRFSFDSRAKAIARSVERLASPAGTVLSINGTWESGKSSLINLVKRHLTAEKEGGTGKRDEKGMKLLTSIPGGFVDQRVLPTMRHSLPWLQTSPTHSSISTPLSNCR